MQIRTFTIPIHDDGGWADELNRFLGSHRVLEVEREFVQDGPRGLRQRRAAYQAGAAPRLRGKNMAMR